MVRRDVAEKEGSSPAYEPKNGDLMPDTWKDDAHMMYGTSASAVGVIYNTAVFPQLNADWGELASDPAYQNQMVIPDRKIRFL